MAWYYRKAGREDACSTLGNLTIHACLSGRYSSDGGLARSDSDVVVGLEEAERNLGCKTSSRGAVTELRRYDRIDGSNR